MLLYGGGAVFLALVATILAFTVGGSVKQTIVSSSTTAAAVTTSSESAMTSTTAMSLTVGTSTSSNTIPLSTSTSSTMAAGNTGTYVVVIDPGHQVKGDYNHEPVGPGSTEMKDKVSSGTHSVNTGAPESELVLAVGLKLRDSLAARGIRVVMTRTAEDVAVSNVQRAQIANEAGADLFVRIHADGATNASTHGILMLYPATIKGWTDDIAVESKRAARLALDALIAATGAHSRGMVARSDLTGFNWSDVPVILPEIGLMTNRTEDALLATEAYQDKIVQGLTSAILNYLGVS
jgi:N-acetylmuramoyl-L-alanine amidase